MLIGFICDSSSVLTVIKIVKTVLKILQVIAPIALIISLMFVLTNDVKDPGNEMLPGFKKKIVPSCIAIAALFLVPVLVKMVVNLSSTEENNYAACLENATTEKIAAAKMEEINVLVNNALASGTETDYLYAIREVNKMDDSEEKESMLQELSVIKKVIDIEKLVKKAASSISKETYEQALEAVNSLEDGELKTKLLEKLAEIKKKMSSSSYVVDGSDAYYSGLRPLSGKNIGTLLSENGSSISELNDEIKSAVESAGVGTREAAVAAATTLIGKLAGYKYKLNYEWWGKYENLGIDSRWGDVLSSSQYNRDCNNYAERHDGDGSNCWDNMKWYGFDCSGFSKWILIQAFQNTSASYFGGQRRSMNANAPACDIGDPIYRTGHVAIIVGLKDDTKQYVIAESSQGVTLTNVSYGDTKWWCEHITTYSN